MYASQVAGINVCTTCIRRAVPIPVCNANDIRVHVYGMSSLRFTTTYTFPLHNKFNQASTNHTIAGVTRVKCTYNTVGWLTFQQGGF